MKSLRTLFLFIFLVSTGALSQNYQVTNIQGVQSLDPPVLDIQSSTAHITYGTNFWFYSFPASGPSAPISTSSAVHPSSSFYAPLNVRMKSNSTGIVICYIDYLFSPTPGWYVESVSSPDGGINWTTPWQLEQIAPAVSLSSYYDNVVLEKGGGMGGTALLYYRVPADYNRFHMANNHGFGPTYSFSMLFPAGDSIHAASNLSCFAIPNGPTNDIIYSAFSVADSLYLITHNTATGMPGAPSKILSISGSGSYFTRTRLVGNPNGTLYLAYGFWQLIPGEGMSHTMNQGTVLYKSTNSGSTWSFADTISQTMYAVYDLQMTSTGTLVHVKAENANVYVQSSLDGSHWSSFSQVNPTANTATGKNTFGISTALVDNANIGIAWIDTTTGNDEIFYRKMAIPTAPAVGVAEINNSAPSQFALNQNYPNPFNPTTVISYQLSVSSKVNLKICDLLGRKVTTLVNGVESAGHHAINFDGSGMPSGIYFYRLQAGTYTATRKLVLMK